MELPIYLIGAIGLLFVILILGMLLMHLRKIKALKNEIAKLSLQEHRYQVAMELSNDILFEYDIVSDTMRKSEKYREIFGRNPVIYNYTENMADLDYIHPEDRALFGIYCHDLHLGREFIEVEYRIKNDEGEYIWCHIRGKTVYKKDHLPLQVIGKIVDVDIQKKELEKLQFKAERDPLTNVYNKGATKELISDIVQSSKRYIKHALFVIDIDDFKRINDQYGHLLGDQVLTNIISNIASMFRENDIVGRIGGDEFVALMTNVTSRDQIIHKAENIAQAFSDTYYSSGKEVAVSGSIGIAVFPMDGQTYEELIKNADMALYQVKNTGKNNYQLYGEMNAK